MANIPSWPLISYGQSSKNVTALQLLLMYRGYSLTADGIFGNATKSAVMSFQTSRGLSVDGIAGANTLSALIVLVQSRTNNSAARAAQVLLSKFESLTIDGDFYTGSHTATTTFQNKMGITESGAVNALTWRYLFGYNSYPSDSGSGSTSGTDSVNNNNLNENIEAYTNFNFYGHAIQIPYYNGGKISTDTIRANLLSLCGGSVTGLTKSYIQNKATTNSSMCGIDCSGFVLRVANESTMSSNTVLNYFAGIARSIDPGFPSSGVENQYTYGILASTLTSLSYCQQITTITEVKPGDFIRFSNGDHVGIVKEVRYQILDGIAYYFIAYAHSSGGKGPHIGYVRFNWSTVQSSPGAPLSAGDWSDWDDWNTGYSSTIKGLFNYVCRPNCLV